MVRSGGTESPVLKLFLGLSLMVPGEYLIDPVDVVIAVISACASENLLHRGANGAVLQTRAGARDYTEARSSGIPKWSAPKGASRSAAGPEPRSGGRSSARPATDARVRGNSRRARATGPRMPDISAPALI